MRYILILPMTLLLCNTWITAKKVSPDSTSHVSGSEEKILLGEIEPITLWNEMPEWKNDYFSFEPDTETVQKIKSVSQNFKIVCVLGTWCSDSKNGVPPFIKTLDTAQNNKIKLKLIAVDREKSDPQNSAVQLGIDRVPTFVVYYHNNEIGRMIEIPLTTFEQDFLEIIKPFN